jgi:hypothetical protein
MTSIGDGNWISTEEASEKGGYLNTLTLLGNLQVQSGLHAVEGGEVHFRM